MTLNTHSYPIARLGIIGGGQLGRMMVKAARRLGCACTILDPTPGSPAGQVAAHQIVGSPHDPAKLRELVETCEVTTYDIEDIDTDTLIELEREGRRIVPSPTLLAVIQDKFLQKQALRDAGIPIPDFIEIPVASPEALVAFGYPLVQKARRGGYDGRGVAVLRGPGDLDRILPGPSMVERFVEEAREIAVLVARGHDGDTRTYRPVDMLFRAGENVLDLLLAPADLTDEQEFAARDLAVRTVCALGGVGLFGVEMFLDRSGRILVNEVAPRTHNSGHWTIEACMTDQFEQHLRAVLGLPLGATDLLCPAVMLNLLGAPSGRGRPLIRGLAAALAIPGVCVHIYGKSVCLPHRKMGHVTVLDMSREAARIKAEQVRQVLTITGEGYP
ncbi:MAG: 5-(carboxyamino)imidazole ribonucleotide synthase [Kiritimatiellia bacterium]|nr:5-(carboxyamino)imidazole ribonucleotide synthase [Kiritimatiellia bacterium]